MRLNGQLNAHLSMRALFCASIGLLFAAGAAMAADPLRIGLSLSLTGPTSPAGKQVLAGLEIWRDDVNAKGGLLGRPVELVYYDDQGGPANAPGIYAKLVAVDRVDLLIGPYSTNVIAAAMPAIMQNDRTTIGIFGLGVNRTFKYPRYFSMNSQGPSPANYSKCMFDLAMQQTPKPKRIALIGADVEYSRNALDGARENAKALGFEVVFERTYPLSTTEFTRCGSWRRSATARPTARQKSSPPWRRCRQWQPAPWPRARPRRRPPRRHFPPRASAGPDRATARS